MNDVLSSRDACVKRIRDLAAADVFTCRYALLAAMELMDLGSLNDLVETVENWFDDDAVSNRRLLQALDERFAR